MDPTLAAWRLRAWASLWGPEPRRVPLFLSLGSLQIVLLAPAPFPMSSVLPRRVGVGLGGCREEAERWEQKC